MGLESYIFLISLLAFVLYLWGRKPGERREKEWVAILLGLLLILSLGPIKPTAKGGWIGWIASMGRVVCIAWLIARGAKATQVR